MTKAFGPNANKARLQIRAEEHETKLHFRIDFGEESNAKIAKYTIGQVQLVDIDVNRNSMLELGEPLIVGFRKVMLEFGKHAGDR